MEKSKPHEDSISLALSPPPYKRSHATQVFQRFPFTTATMDWTETSSFLNSDCDWWQLFEHRTGASALNQRNTFLSMKNDILRFNNPGKSFAYNLPTAYFFSK